MRSRLRALAAGARAASCRRQPQARTVPTAGYSGLRRAEGLRPRRRVSPLRGSPKYDSLRETVGIAAPPHVTPALSRGPSIGPRRLLNGSRLAGFALGRDDSLSKPRPVPADIPLIQPIPEPREASARAAPPHVTPDASASRGPCRSLHGPRIAFGTSLREPGHAGFALGRDDSLSKLRPVSADYLALSSTYSLAGAGTARRPGARGGCPARAAGSSPARRWRRAGC